MTSLLYSIVIMSVLFSTTFAAEFAADTATSTQNSAGLSVIDMQDPNAPALFLRSLRQTGFALFSNHGIDTNGLKEDWQNFYNRPEADKMKSHYANDPAGNGLGYYPYAAEKAEGATAQNKMEYYHDAAGHELPDCISTKTKTYFSNMEAIKILLSRWIDQEHKKEGFVLPQRLLDQGIDSIEKMSEPNLPANIVRILHYPASSENIGEIVNLQHTDISAFSLLFGTEPGLELQAKDGSWHGVGGNSEVLVVNAGDMLMWGTDGHLPENSATGIKSTVHRVIRANGNERYSFPAFFGVKPWIQILPDATAGEAFRKRIYGNLTKAS